MSFEASLFSYLSTNAGITALVVKRVYPGIIPQSGVQPCIVYNKQGRDRQQLFCGVDGLLMTRVEIDSYATTYLQSVTLANAVTAALENFEGDMSGTEVPKVFLENEIDLSDIEPGLYRQSQSWAFWHRSL
jgi:hypothetical protein